MELLDALLYHDGVLVLHGEQGLLDLVVLTVQHHPIKLYINLGKNQLGVYG